MSRSGALSRARALRDELTARGVPTSIEIQQGRPGTPNGRWYDTRFIGTMGHHIVSRRSQGLTPGLSLIKRGRSDVPGPLCNGYLGFDGRARIICMGWANHPGAGGGYNLPGGRVPRNQGRPYFFGWEIEGGLSESDWPASFRVVMGKVHAATLAWLGRDQRSHIEHKHWAPTRKIDRLNYTLGKARNELRPHLAGDDMTPEQADMLKDLHVALVNGNRAQVKHPDGDNRSSLRYAGERSWLHSWRTRQAVEALTKIVTDDIAERQGTDPDELYAGVQKAVEDGIAAGVQAEIPTFVAAVLDQLGDIDVSQDAIVAALERVLREGVGNSDDDA